MSRRHSASGWFHAGLLWLLAVILSGCVTTVYQPLVSLQRPVIIDPQVANFEGQRFLLRCIPGDYLKLDEAQQLCQHLRTLFTTQGAQVDVQVQQGGMVGGDEEGEARPDLIIDLRARLLHEDNSTLLWILSGLTLTLVPAITESSFSQDVTIRDSSGFLLASDNLQGRFVRYSGFSVWAVNGVLDLLVRSEAEKLGGDRASRDFSRDFYGQLSQLAFNAHMRSVVMRGFEPEPPSSTK
ncbi:hypothetical protein JQX13_37070 [Archangium violaceum]|nr:hypothetical protein JQX13_37070 [Archangium violaceum]